MLLKLPAFWTQTKRVLHWVGLVTVRKSLLTFNTPLYNFKSRLCGDASGFSRDSIRTEYAGA